MKETPNFLVEKRDLHSFLLPVVIDQPNLELCLSVKHERYRSIKKIFEIRLEENLTRMFPTILGKRLNKDID